MIWTKKYPPKKLTGFQTRCTSSTAKDVENDKRTTISTRVKWRTSQSLLLFSEFSAIRLPSWPYSYKKTAFSISWFHSTSERERTVWHLLERVSPSILPSVIERKLGEYMLMTPIAKTVSRRKRLMPRILGLNAIQNDAKKHPRNNKSL